MRARWLILTLLTGLSPALPAAVPVELTRQFQDTVQPLLRDHCLGCHSTAKHKGDLDLEKFQSPAQILEQSKLWHRVLEQVSNLEMPPADKPQPSPKNRVFFERWLKDALALSPQSASNSTALSGKVAAGQKHWSFQPLQTPAATGANHTQQGHSRQSPRAGENQPRPAASSQSKSSATIDAFIQAKLPEQKLAPTADKWTLLRRATYDLTGLPPSVDEVEAFERDQSADAFAKVVDRLLASKHYGERWGRHWLDLVRYADTAGETADYPVPVAWRYRNWVIDAFNEDKPYDEFLREQIAGDILARQGPRERYAERVTATGYLAISRRFGFDSENYHHLTIQDTIDTLGQTVLGLTLGCARCHAHKFDPVSMQDYYALYGIFESTRYAFPGSEQKQRSRSMVPLLPPEESVAKWREFDTRVASLSRNLEKQKQSVPSAVLRSLDDMDGDFEMQAPAAGGSKGVLVPPWVYAGPIAVTMDAQSPYKNLYALGRMGASVAAGTNAYRIAQAVHPARNRKSGRMVFVNLDFRIGGSKAPATGVHRFWIGSRQSAPAVEVLISSEAVSVRADGGEQTIRAVKPDQWQNLQLALDLKSRVVTGSVGVPGDVTAIAERKLATAWDGVFDFVTIDSEGGGRGQWPAVAVDNLGVQSQPMAPVSRELPALVGGKAEIDFAALSTQLQAMAGIDGDFELQTDGSAPATPWGPGPNSVVKIRASAQSPFRNLYAAGQLGVHLPNSGAYNGFGQTLTNRWKAEKTERLYASFDFRCASVEKGGEGTWRYYLGHGPGSSAAIELFFNGREFFRRSADKREVVQLLRVGEWYQVQLALNLKEKTYTGSISSVSNRTEFGGKVASGWDGSVDYTFIDSYGHIGGVKPSLDADNFILSETPLKPFGAEAIQLTEAERASRQAKVAAMRRQLAEMTAAAEKSKQELQSLLVDGPVEIAYAVSEGTPQNARLQMRGEPDKPGDEVPRGFLQVLGGGTIPDNSAGSGRLELANWITRPDNPLTARVMANRLWQYHFGQGLVKTPNDFGTRGQPPTHPELLDYLATEFIKRGWSMKAMHRLIMLSATYQQAAAGQESGVGSQGSGDSRALNLDTLSSFPRRRLSAEEIRDSILLVSGELDSTPGRGHPFPAPTGWGYTQHGPYSAVYDHNQRSIYLMTQRIKRHPFLTLFDGADPNASTADRRTTTVPTQALYFLNDPFIHAKSEKFAERLAKLGRDDVERITAAYRLAVSRPPTDTERAEALDFLATYRSELAAAKKGSVDTLAFAALGRVLFGSNEFLTVD